MLTGLDENLDLKDENPGMADAGLYYYYNLLNGEEDPRP